MESLAVKNAAADLRNMPASEWEHLGRESLREHLLAQATVAHQKYTPLTGSKLEGLLHDPGCVRFPVRLVFEFGEMASHQFAQPDIDWRNEEHDGRVLFLRPALRDKPELLLYAVAYMIPVLNYGNIVSDEHCVLYGAALLGLMEEEFYSRICAMADAIGAATRLAGPPQP